MRRGTTNIMHVQRSAFQSLLNSLTLMHDLIRDHSQFIISTHSPIRMAYPHSYIYLLTEKGIKRVNYEDTDHYRITRDFLNRHEKMMHYLLSELPLDQ
jgi:predicted ATPase